MTMIGQGTMKCAICGNVQEEASVLYSFHVQGALDLDFRDPGADESKAEGLLLTQVHMCNRCGYCSLNLSDEIDTVHLPRLDRLLHSERYKNCDGIAFRTETARKFFRHFLIQSLVVDDREAALDPLMKMIWQCDDDDDEESARLCRRKFAVPLLRWLVKNGDPDDRDEYLIRLCDVLRRAGNFEQCRKEFRWKWFGQFWRFERYVIRYQMKLCKKKDDRRYSMRAVFPWKRFGYRMYLPGFENGVTDEDLKEIKEMGDE